MVTNRLPLFFRGEGSRSFGKTDGVRRSPRLPFVLVVFFTLVSSFALASVLSTLLFSPRLSPLPVSVVGVSDAPARARGVRKPFDVEAFKRTIIDNNIFRPLGWTPPRPIEPYRLIGTILPRSGNTSATAILETTEGNVRYIVSVGDKIEVSTEVISIDHKSVLLSTEGRERRLRLSSGF